MARAYSLSFSGGLDAVAAQFGLPPKKAEGKALIRRFSMPQHPSRTVSRWTAENDPESWDKFKQYCVQDVEVERSLSKKLNCYPYHSEEQDYYTTDQEINDRGVPVDKALVAAALRINVTERASLMAEMKDLTHLSNPNSGKQLLEWLATKGLILKDLTKDTVAKELARNTWPPLIRNALELKQQLAKTSVTKWNAIDRAVCQDARLRGMFQFAGASRTQRWAGRIVQLHNLARGGNTTKDPDTLCDVMISGGHEAVKCLYGEPMLALSDTIRQAITAPEGKILNVSDLSSIESRVVGWVAGCKSINNTFATGKDTYKVFASQLYKIPYEKVTKQQRTFCKPTTLGGAYGLGWKGLIGYAEGMGVTMSETEAKTAIDVFRSEYHEIVELWRWCEHATFYTTRTGNVCEGKHGLRTFAKGEFLFLQLPSGRSIAYHKPEVQLKEAPWGDMVENFTFMGMEQFTRKWVRISAFGGKIVENLVQAIARDILAIWVERAKKAGFTIIGHVHDEGICLEDSDRVEELNALIKKPIPWATGLILDAEGYTSKRYKKG